MEHGKHGQAKVHTVLSEFKRGALHSGSGGIVKSRKQAIAIALSEAGLSRKKKKGLKEHTAEMIRKGHLRAK